MDAKIKTNLQKIISGQLTYKSPNLAFNMMISRMQMKIKTQPNCFEECLKEIEDFAAKYPTVIKIDYDKIAAL